MTPVEFYFLFLQLNILGLKIDCFTFILYKNSIFPKKKIKIFLSFARNYEGIYNLIFLTVTCSSAQENPIQLPVLKEAEKTQFSFF